jgi:L-ascorbate metabolism protein UlaG (beta-lactamase superfamily)
MIENIECLGHSTIKFNKMGKIIYVDPYNIKEEIHDADIIFVTHSHYDHYSEEDITKIKRDDTKIVVTSDLANNVIDFGFMSNDVTIVLPNNKYEVDYIKFSTVNSYNINKQFHPKENNWVGYIIELDGIKYYIAGDTDINEDNKKVKCDVAFVPVGGTYTTTAKEAAEFVNIIKPKVAVPIHYGTIVGSEEDANIFRDNVEENIEVKIMM